MVMPASDTIVNSMRLLYFICALVALGWSPAVAQSPAPPPADARGYTIFLRGTPIGREDITVRNDGGVTVISGTGRLSPPIDIVTRHAEVRYAADWSPVSLALDAVVRLREETVRIAFSNGEARVEATVSGKPVSKVDKVARQTL